MTNRKIEAILFDFDGTIADTSVDMINCLNILLANKNRANVNIDKAKNFISKGAGGLISYSCPELTENERKEYIHDYLEIYKDNYYINTRLFDGINEIIDLIISKNYKWGIVTNKPGFLVIPIIKELNLRYQPHCIVAGDTLNVKKPNPKPLLYAAEKISCEPVLCAYIGDDLRDIQAANSANMFSIAASYGFIENKSDIKKWGCDYIINSPLDLKNLIG